MTQKQIFAIAASVEAMSILKEIECIQRCLCYKTFYEQKSAKAKMKMLAKELLEVIEA